jgi:FlaA1/EpsC-like NDP-sugar epimerase
MVMINIIVIVVVGAIIFFAEPLISKLASKTGEFLGHHLFRVEPKAIKLLNPDWRPDPTVIGSRILIYGAGIMGKSLLKNILNKEVTYETGLKFSDLEPQGFIDDNPELWGTKIAGLVVLGGRQDLERIIREQDIHGVVVAIMDIKDSPLKKIAEICRKANSQCSRFGFCFKNLI